MPLEVFKKAVDDIVRNDLAEAIQLHVLGEPLLYKNIFEAVSYAASQGLRVMLTTNGSLLTDDKIFRLVEAGLYSIDLSLQLYDSRRHQARNTNIQFDDYRERLHKAIATIHKQTDLQLIVKMMNTKFKWLFHFDNALGLDQKGPEFRGIVIGLIEDIYRTIGRECDSGEIAGILKGVNLDSAKRIRLADKLFVFVQLFMDWGNAFTRRVYPVTVANCSFAFTSPSVLSDGSVCICCGDYDGGTRLGNLQETPLSEILHSETARHIWSGFQRNRLLLPYCQRCLGGGFPGLCWLKGLGTIFLTKHVNLQGGNAVIIK